MTVRRVAGPVGRLHVDDGGEKGEKGEKGEGGETLVFLHALAGNGTHWERQLAEFRSTHRAIAIDLRGHGRSDTTEGAEYSLDAYAADLSAVMDALEIKRGVLIGHSLGAGVAIAYASARPERVSRLLLADPVGDARLEPEERTAEFLAMVTQDYRTVIEGYWSTLLENARPDVRDRILEDLRVTPRRVVTETFRKLLEFDVSGALRRFEGPVLSVITPFNTGRSCLHEILPDLPTETVIGTSHWLQFDQPGVFVRALRAFLARQ